MKLRHFLFLLCIMFMLVGCYSTSSLQENGPVENVTKLTVGHSLEVKDIDSRLTLVDNNSTLAADGLYYVSWGMGESRPYENSDGDSVDLYDASLYLLLGESKNPESAQNNVDTWLNAAKSNYEILNEELVTCNDQTYTLITYNCISENTPYEQGISAFGTIGSSAVCIELTCCENFNEDLKPILTDFLDNCYYTN